MLFVLIYININIQIGLDKDIYFKFKNFSHFNPITNAFQHTFPFLMY